LDVRAALILTPVPSIILARLMRPTTCGRAEVAPRALFYNDWNT
jgi:hypothetical protein